jgi:hypothetical protein
MFSTHWNNCTSRKNVALELSALQDKKFWEELIAYFLWYDTGHIENDTSNNYSIGACLFVPRYRFYQAIA